MLTSGQGQVTAGQVSTLIYGGRVAYHWIRQLILNPLVPSRRSSSIWSGVIDEKLG